MKKFFLLIAALLCAASLYAVEFKPAVELFLERYTSIVKGKRVGLITNPTGVDSRLNPTVDLLRRDPRVNLVALFAPEHGIRGDVAAGQHIKGGRDPVSGLPVYSLYGGRDHRPTPEQLSQVDVLIYNIQDIGVRTYTYIWHLAECMAAAGEAGIPVIVFDVPNVAGARNIDGPVREEKFKSFIGLYPVPYTYGLTVGELARYLKHEENIRCKLYIVPMQGYRRSNSWRDTGMKWVPTSPQIPSDASALCYGVTGPIGTLGSVDIGINQELPFQVAVAPWLNGRKLADKLNGMNLKGIVFRPLRYKAPKGRFTGKYVEGVQLQVTDPDGFDAFSACVAMLCCLREYPEFTWGNSGVNANEGFDKAAGTDRIRKMIQAGRSHAEIVASYRGEVEAFRRRAAKYHIYK